MQSQETIGAQALRHFWFYCFILGLRAPRRYKLIFYVYSFIINFINMFLFPFCYIFYFMYDAKSVFEVIDMQRDFLSILSSTIKVAILYFMLDRLRDIGDAMDRLEKHPKISSADRIRLQEMVKVANRIFWCFVLSFNFFVLFELLKTVLQSERVLIAPNWFPYDWKASAFAFWATFVYETVVALDTVNRNIPTDGYPSFYLLILIEHFAIMSRRLKNIGWQKEHSAEENYEILVDCFKVHANIMSIFVELSKIISKTIVCQLILAAFTIAFAIIPIFIFHPPILHIVTAVTLIAALVLQILPSCYYGDKFMAMSDQFGTLLYSCNWMDQSPRFKKTILIFMMVTQKKKVILVGNLVPVNMMTLLQILKFAYTLVTFLMQVSQ